MIGTLLTLSSLDVAEILSRSGFDWLFIDLEHSAINSLSAQGLLQVIAERSAALVRVESSDEVGVRKALDIGATGIIVPQVNSAEQAERIVSLAKYPPAGCRSVGLGRATNFGNNFADYISRANQETLVVVQIEHVDSVSQIDKIAKVPGIDAFFVGPYDLSGSFGKPGAIDAPEVTEAINRVLSVAKSNNIPVGIFSSTAAGALRYQQQGFSLIALSTDGMLLGRAATAELNTLKG